MGCQKRVDGLYPGIVKGIGMAINVFVKEDEKVIIQPPVYHPFRLTPEGNRRKVVFNPLIENADGTYSMDFDNLAEVADEKCRLLILSNPHNPAVSSGTARLCEGSPSSAMNAE